MIIADLNKIEGRTYPAKRRTRSFIGKGLAIETENFNMGMVELEPNGGQVPWHNQEQEEVYLILEGTCQMCLDEECQTLTGGQAVYIPSGVFHQLTNIGDQPARMLYCYSPAGDVDHWKQELAGTLPKAGVDVPPLPAGAYPQCTEKPQE
jgi:quercetin dioxygenase-like cupin family protein